MFAKLLSIIYEFFADALASIFSFHLEIDPKQNIIVITGCDSGLGEMSAIQLTNQGYLVVTACLTDTGVQNMKRAGIAAAVKCDVTKEKDVMTLVDATDKLIVSKGARLWCVVNNAGIAPSGAIDWFSIDSARKTMEVNYFAVILMIKAFLPLLKKTRQSRIINISSLAGISTAPMMGGYCASKHAVEGLCKALKQELAPWGVRVININPSFVRTPLIKSSIEGSIKEFDNAPKEITNQYNREIVTKFTQMIHTLAEDPQLVVDKIIGNVTLARPFVFNPVGYGGAFVRCWNSVAPLTVQNFFERLTYDLFCYVGPTPDALNTFQRNK